MDVARKQLNAIQIIHTRLTETVNYFIIIYKTIQYIFLLFNELFINIIVYFNTLERT